MQKIGGGVPKDRGPGQFADLRGAWQGKGGCDTPMHTL